VHRVLSKHEARHIPGRAAVDSWRRGGWCALVGIGFTTSMALWSVTFMIQDARSHEIKMSYK
jgi:Na+/H+ antiporter NhaA